MENSSYAKNGEAAAVVTTPDVVENFSNAQDHGEVGLLTTPPRPICVGRKLDFGVNLTPELAASRATPEATPIKRVLAWSPETPGGSASKRQNCSRIPTMNVIQHLMGARPRCYSSPSLTTGNKFRRRRN